MKLELLSWKLKLKAVLHSSQTILVGFPKRLQNWILQDISCKNLCDIIEDVKQKLSSVNSEL